MNEQHRFSLPRSIHHSLVCIEKSLSNGASLVWRKRISPFFSKSLKIVTFFFFFVKTFHVTFTWEREKRKERKRRKFSNLSFTKEKMVLMLKRVWKMKKKMSQLLFFQEIFFFKHLFLLVFNYNTWLLYMQWSRFHFVCRIVVVLIVSFRRLTIYWLLFCRYLNNL